MAKILIINDNGIVRDALAVFLSRNGHEVLLSKDGFEGLSVFSDSKPDLVILDRNLPHMTGSQVLDEIKKTSPKTPVIILTSHDSPVDAERYLKNGATAFLSKADGLSLVITEVQKILGETEEEQSSSAEKILIVDDEESIVKMLKRFLLTKKFEVSVAFDGLSALDVYKKEQPNLILLDIGLPGKNGLEVLKELKSFDENALIIMVTGNADAEIGRECLKVGAADYIAKPINLAALDRSVKTILYMNKIGQ